MLFIISIILSLLFVKAAAKSIKKHASIYYIVTVILTAAMYYYSKANLSEAVPQFVNKYITALITRSAISTAMFTLVMYAAVMNKKWDITKKIYSIRGELSIIACIITLGHNISYGEHFFITLFKDPSQLTIPKYMATIISLILVVLMLVLMITSFKFVRKNMNFKTWKNIQRTAYLFYGLIYIHIMCLFVPKFEKCKLNIAAYSIIFLGYGLLRIRKYISNSSKNKERVKDLAAAN